MRFVAAVAVSLLLSGCAGERFDLAEDPLGIAAITFGTGTDDRGFLTDTREAFSVQDRKIYTMVELRGVRREVPVTGIWTYLESGEEVARTTIAASPLREFARFDLQSPSPLPVGRYVFTAEAEQGEERVRGTAEFRVVGE